MFTLGNKEAIVNSTTAFPFVPTAAGSDILNIKGFGTFSKLKLVSAIARRASDAQYEKLSFTCPTSLALGIGATDVGIAVIVHIRVNSLRQASESAIDFIKRGRPMILEVKINGGSADTVVATAVKAAFDEYALKFANITLPITAAISGADIILTATQGYFSINDNVAFLKRGDIFALNATSTKNFDSGLEVKQDGTGGGEGGAIPTAGDTTIILDALTGLCVNDTIQFATAPTVDYKITEIVTSTKTITFTPALGNPVTAADENTVYKTQKGVEAVNDGKFLEETVRMSTGFTSDAYAINAGQVPIIGDKYTMIQWVHDDPVAAGGWAAHKNPGAVAKQMTRNKYTLYFNESLLGATSQVKYLADWLVDGAPNIATFKKANGATAADVADFWA
jgi:hypothetical protein